jgi:diadenosine tetraphosphate (Ap4A) HIT family hydrolase
VSAVEDMTEDEAQVLGLLLHRCSRALRAVTGCMKTYFMFFAEAEGFSHLHVHVVPRMASFTEEQIGPRVFGFLARPEEEWLSEGERDDLALRLRAALGVGVPDERPA